MQRAKKSKTPVFGWELWGKKVVRGGFTEKVTFEQRTEGGEGGSYEDFWETAPAKALGHDSAWCVGGTVTTLCGWSRVSKGERRRWGGWEGDRAGHAEPCGSWGELGL